MSDILVYSAITEKARLEALKASLGAASLNLEDARIATEGNTGPNFLGSATPYYTPGGGGATKPKDIGAQWCSIFGALAAPKANGIKVCDPDSYKRCGASCTWTVPAGVERVTYQMWGAGTGSASICCCGGSPYGTNGSFAIGEFDVVQGDILCMCSACAYCCYAEQTTPGQAVAATCLTAQSAGGGFVICAPSGPNPHICRWHCALSNQGLSPYPGCMMWQPDVDDTSCAIQFCDGCWNFCWDTNGDKGFTPMVYDHVCKPNFINQANFDAKNATLYGIPAMWGEMSVGNNWCADPDSYLLNAPVFGFPNINCKADMNITTCCPGCCFRACVGIQSAPSIGGFPSRIISGGGACYGDSGGMGMICISYNCI
jgi:hypothetical protein